MGKAFEQQWQEDTEPLSFRFSPNCSLSPRAEKQAFWIIAGSTLMASSVISMMGYWLVMPFAGLEIGILAWAFETLGKRRGDYESVRVLGDDLHLESRRGNRTNVSCVNRYWVDLFTRRDGVSGHMQLMVRSHGRETEVGMFLTDDDRMALFRMLKAWQTAQT